MRLLRKRALFFSENHRVVFERRGFFTQLSSEIRSGGWHGFLGISRPCDCPSDISCTLPRDICFGRGVTLLSARTAYGSKGSPRPCSVRQKRPGGRKTVIPRSKHTFRTKYKNNSPDHFSSTIFCRACWTPFLGSYLRRQPWRGIPRARRTRRSGVSVSSTPSAKR